MPNNENEEMLASFVSEAFDQLDACEPLVEDLKNEEHTESVNAIFRAFHTIKGLAGFFGMPVINRLCHEAETLLDLMRKNERPQDEETLTVIYQSIDLIRALLNMVNEEFTDEGGAEEADNMILVIKDAIKKYSEETGGGGAKPKEETPPVEEKVAEPETESVEEADEEIDLESEMTEEGMVLDDIISPDMMDQFVSTASELLETAEKNLLYLENEPKDKDKIRETFQAIHSLKGNAGFMGLSPIEEIAMEIETILDAVRNEELDIDSSIVSVLLGNLEQIRKLIAEAEAKIEELSEGGEEETKEEVPKEKEQEKKEAPAKVEEKKAEEVGKEVAKTKEEASPQPAKKEPTPKKSKPPSVPKMQRKDIRVETKKIDMLFDMVGELITIEAMVTGNPDLEGLNLPNFQKSASMLNKITRELQEISMSIRMMPLEGLFFKMKRLVRDVSLKMKKKVNLIVSGEETEMDKNVIDEISDPLVHILRNAVDHGIEPPEERIAAGKPEEGTVKLSAKYEGNEILIIIEDDGKGIDREAVLRKAEEKGLLKAPPEEMSDRDVFQLIFEPGFSTAKVVTDISGRGVGMDVVRKNIEKLRGKVTVDSVYGKGSTFTLRIPLTLAIMEAMILRIGKDKYATPLLAVRETFRPSSEQIATTMDGLEIIKVREEVLPIIRLYDLLGIKPDSENFEDGIFIIVDSGEKSVCLFVDEIIGQQQAVIKGLSDYIGKVPGLTGCMILGDGSIGLILDIEGIIEMSMYDKISVE